MEELLQVTENSDDVQKGMRYEDSGIDERILRAVKELGFEYMTPIQEQAIPMLMEGKDIIGQAQTGTGKTAAFGIPMLQKMDPEDRELQGLILCPTRELAMQAAEELRKFAKYMHGVKVVPIYGGQDISRQITALKGGAQIIVGTPGRVMDHMRRHTIRLDHTRLVVLDEADEMLNMGFKEDMETILGEIVQDHQTALFSATMPQAILDITHAFQKEDAEMVKITKKELTISLIKQCYFVVKSIYKEEVIGRILEQYGFARTIIFCNTKRKVDELSDNLKKRGFQAEGLHGDLTQKQRDFVMNRFKSGSLQILIATDVAARGIDVDDLEAVINYDIPQDIEYYVHRIGRTGRAGKEGMSFTFAYGRDIYKIRDIERVCKTRMTELPVPKASQILDIKTSKILDKVYDRAKQGGLERTVDIIENRMTDLDVDVMELLAAMIKMQVGDSIQEIEIETSVRKPKRGERRRDGEKHEEGSEKRRRRNRDGEDHEEERGKRRRTRDGEEHEEERGKRRKIRDGEGYGEERGKRRRTRDGEDHEEERGKRRRFRDGEGYGEERSKRRKEVPEVGTLRRKRSSAVNGQNPEEYGKSPESVSDKPRKERSFDKSGKTFDKPRKERVYDKPRKEGVPDKKHKEGKRGKYSKGDAKDVRTVKDVNRDGSERPRKKRK